MARTASPRPTAGRSRELPAIAQSMALEHSEVWRAFQSLGEAASRAGPLDARTRRLVHLAMSIAVGSEGATHSHARRALSEGISADELEHVAMLAITAVGWAQAIKGLSWLRDIARGEADPRGEAAEHSTPPPAAP
jgi:4-carboxymuconolactone decarboxylase